MYLLAIFLCLTVTLNQVNAEPEIDLKGKVTIITGAARGIGYAIAEHFLKEDVKVVIIVDKNLTQGLVTESEFKTQYGSDKVWFIHGDVTTDLERVCDEVFERYEYVDILVNNAGILNENDPELMVRTNLLAPLLWSQKFYNFMRQDQGGKGGIILNIASIDAYDKMPFVRFYKSTKSGLLGYSLGLGHEWNYMSSNVKVIALSPGLTDTYMIKQDEGLGEQAELEMLGKYMQSVPDQIPDVVGQAAVTVCKTGKTGMAYTIEGGELFVSPDSEYISVEYLRNLQ